MHAPTLQVSIQYWDCIAFGKIHVWASGSQRQSWAGSRSEESLSYSLKSWAWIQKWISLVFFIQECKQSWSEEHNLHEFLFLGLGNTSWGPRSVDAIKPKTDVECTDQHLHRSTCLASRISIQMEPFLKSEFTPALHSAILHVTARNCTQLMYEKSKLFFHQWTAWRKAVFVYAGVCDVHIAGWPLYLHSRWLRHLCFYVEV